MSKEQVPIEMSDLRAALDSIFEQLDGAFEDALEDKEKDFLVAYKKHIQ